MIPNRVSPVVILSALLQLIMTILTAMLGVAGVLLAGAAARRVGLLRPRLDPWLLKLIVRGLFPALSFSVVAGNEKLREPLRVITPPLVGFFSIVLGFATAALAARLFRRGLRLEPPAVRTFVFSVGIYNYGYIALPIIMLLFDDPETQSVLFLHNMGIDLAFWTVGMLVMAGRFGTRDLIKAVNPPGVAILVALLCQWSGLARHIPPELIEALRLTGLASLPLGLLLIGATMMDHLPEAGLRQGGRVILLANVLRLGIIPVFFLLVARFLPCSVELKRVIVTQAAMPAGVISIIIAKHYRGDVPTAMRVILTTNAICLLTAPLWLPAGMWFASVR
jgi:predicted permease